MQRIKQNEQREVAESGYTRSDWRKIALAGITLIPLTLVVFFRIGAGSPVVVAVVTGLAIIAAAYFLSWATEALETVVAQSVALALLALVEVASEYTFEVILAYRRQTELASASMTGANRLLLGLGWPMIFFVAYLSSRRKGQVFTEIRLDYRNAPEFSFCSWQPSMPLSLCSSAAFRSSIRNRLCVWHGCAALHQSGAMA